MFSTLFAMCFMALILYITYRILKKSVPDMKVKAMLNRFVAHEAPVQNGGQQPAHDLNTAMTNDHRLREVNQLERVFENGYKVSTEGEWRG